MERDSKAGRLKPQQKDTVIGDRECQQNRHVARETMHARPETPGGWKVEHVKHAGRRQELKHGPHAYPHGQPSLQMKGVAEEQAEEWGGRVAPGTSMSQRP